MELLKLLGVLIVVIGFALKLDAILIIFAAMIVTGLVGGLGVVGLLETIGTAFVSNRSMAIFVMILLVTGTLERNGLREAAAALIGKVRGATAGKLIGAFGILRGLFAAFNVSFGGVAGFVRPVLLPMAEGAVKKDNQDIHPEHLEALKGMTSGMENIMWFFFQVLFVGGAGGILVQQTLDTLGYKVELVELALVEIPIAITALVVAAVYYYLKDRRLVKKYYGTKKGK